MADLEERIRELKELRDRYAATGKPHLAAALDDEIRKLEIERASGKRPNLP